MVSKNHFDIDNLDKWYYSLCCWPVKHVEKGVAVLIQTGSRFLYYEPKNNGYKLLGIIGIQSSSFKVIPHIPTLVSLKKVVGGVETTLRC